MMFLYLSIIFIAMILVSALNILLGTAYFGYSATFVILAVIVSTIFQFVIDGLTAFIWNKMPDNWFTKECKISNVSKKELKFYEFLKVKKWKDKVWDLGGLAGVSKKHLDNPNDPDYINKFIVECNKGTVEHFVSIFAGFLCIFLFPLKYALVIGVPIALVNVVLNVMPIFVLRYNIPKLKVILKRAERNKAKMDEEIRVKKLLENEC